MRRWWLFCFVILSCISSVAYAQDDYGFKVLGRALPGPANSTFEVGNICYLGSGNVLQIYDLTTPAAPVLLGQLALKGQLEEIVVIANLAYIACGTQGMIIADISTPSNVTIVSHLQLPSEAIGISIVDFYAYIADVDGGFVIVDISDPESPFQTSTFPVNQAALGVDVQDSIAAVACGYGGLYFVDVTDPGTPVQLSNVDAPGVWVYDTKINGNYAYLAYALDSEGGGLKVINITNPAVPQVVGDLVTTYPFDRIDLSGNYVFAAIEDGGLFIANVATPTNPRLIGAWHNGYGKNISYSGNKIYLCGGEEGLWLLNAANIAFPQLLGNIATYSECQDIAVSGRYAYMVEQPAGIRVIDLQNINAPKPVYRKQFNFQNGAYQGVGEGISIVGNQLYVVDYSDINGGQNDFRIYGLTNPAQPDSQGVYLLSSGPRGHQVRNDVAYINTGPTLKVLDVRTPSEIGLINNFEGNWHSGYGMDLSGNYLYLGTMNTGLRILNISNENSPVIVGGLDTDGQTFAARYHNGFAYVADNANGLRIDNVSDPANPFEVASIATYADCVDIGFVSDSLGDFAIVLFDDQVVAYDIADPAHPVQVGYYDTIDPHHIITRGDTIYVADRMNGLHILLLDNHIDAADDANPELPEDIIIAGNYPNPFNSSTTIEFTLPSAGKTTLDIFDITGRKVLELYNGFAHQGLNKVVWDGRDKVGRQLAGGIYFYRIISNEKVTSGKMIFLK